MALYGVAHQLVRASKHFTETLEEGFPPPVGDRASTLDRPFGYHACDDIPRVFVRGTALIFGNGVGILLVRPADWVTQHARGSIPPTSASSILPVVLRDVSISPRYGGLVRVQRCLKFTPVYLQPIYI